VLTEIVFFLTGGFFFGVLLMLAVSGAVAVVFLARRRGERPDSRAFAPPLSVVIPAYNEERNIGRCLDAILANGYPVEKLDVMVVDDGSTDATRDVVRSCRGVRLLEQDHRGKVAALNLGARNARHDFLLTVDADTVLRRGSIAELARPLADLTVGAVTGVAKVRNPRRVLAWFQSAEYLMNAFSRESFSVLFRVFPGVCGALACYRLHALKRVGGFKPDTAAEDFDVALELVRRGFAILAVGGAVGYTEVPETLRALVKQRVRWMRGCMQCFVKHRVLLRDGSPMLRYLVAAQIFWIVYALASLPLIAFSFAYWLPSNAGSLADLGAYVVRWFTVVGPIYMLLKIPEWGINATYFFGILAGLISPILMLVAILRYDRPKPRTLVAVFLYFPYTLLLSVMMMGSLVAYVRSGGRGAFVK
jgi:cellulose synthase/poly-beta-1,6-N-acetylglucosamine synthase-like glycosyltransferase